MALHFAASATIGLAAIMLEAQSAEAAQDAPQGRFELKTAADCGIVFARMTEALQSGATAPQPFVAQVALGQAIWEYELNAAAPGDEESAKAAVAAASERLDAAMPGEEADPGARGDYLMDQASLCGDRVDAAYPEASHPVIVRVQAMAEEQRKKAQSPEAP